MSVSFRPLRPEDVLALQLQPSQHVELGLSRGIETFEEAEELCSRGPAWSAIAGDGRVLCVAGFAEIFPPVHAVAWAMLAEGIGRDHRRITEYARARVDEQNYRRIDLITAARLPCLKWARMLGFERDPYPLRNYGAASELCFLFERINHGPR